MPLVKLTLWNEPAEIPGDEIPILRGQRLYEHTVGGPDDPKIVKLEAEKALAEQKSAPPKRGGPVQEKEK